MTDMSNRRPLKVRGAGFAKKIASWLSKKSITPNQISIISIVFAFFAAFCLVRIPYVKGIERIVLPILAAVFIQCRLLCNLFDGMVAVEGGKSTSSGELFNDIPDRVADSLILIAAGYSITSINGVEMLGWLAALLAVFTAYVRTLSSSVGAPSRFLGPMAKQHRMAVMTVACILTVFEGYVCLQGFILFIALLLIVIGCVITIYRRIVFVYNYLEKNQNV